MDELRCFIDNEGNFFDTTHFSQSLKNYPFKGSGTYLILGKVVEEFGFPSLRWKNSLNSLLNPTKGTVETMEPGYNYPLQVTRNCCES